MKKTILVLPLAGLLLTGTSCVSSKKYADAQEQLKQCQAQNTQSTAQSTQQLADLQTANNSLQLKLKEMAKDTANQSLRMHQIQLANEDLRRSNADLYEKLRSTHNETEVKALLGDLQKIQEKLQAREDTLQKAEVAIRAKEKKVSELNEVIANQNLMMKKLRQRMADALKGYVGNGIQVVEKNGKVHVSMDEKLLFTSGHWDITEKADSALSSIGVFLAANPDIQVTIEGHTDDLAYRGNGYILDNWDLSVKRSTAIVRSLLKNKGINPARITAAGRAEFVPIDDAPTAVARQKNRRTEIILTPNMDEVLKIINGN